MLAKDDAVLTSLRNIAGYRALSLSGNRNIRRQKGRIHLFSSGGHLPFKKEGVDPFSLIVRLPNHMQIVNLRMRIGGLHATKPISHGGEKIP